MFSPDGYRALTEGAGVVRRGDRGVLRVSGTDRLTWLQGLLTNDVLALPEGGICDAAYLTPQGRMITDMRVVNFAASTLLDVPASLADSLATRLDGLLFAEDAQVVNASTSCTVIDIHGPEAPRVVERLHVVRDDAFEVPGFTGFVSSGESEQFVSRLIAAGAVETSLETLDVLRIEAGRPAFLVDMDEHTIPLEANLEGRAISFSKGCYVGQEVIVRVVQRGGGRVAKRLVGLRLAKGEVPRGGELITSGEREVGRVTSACWSPAAEAVLALGYVHRDFSDAGTVLSVAASSGSIPAAVTPLPFVTRR